MWQSSDFQFEDDESKDKSLYVFNFTDEKTWKKILFIYIIILLNQHIIYLAHYCDDNYCGNSLAEDINAAKIFSVYQIDVYENILSKLLENRTWIIYRIYFCSETSRCNIHWCYSSRSTTNKNFMRRYRFNANNIRKA